MTVREVLRRVLERSVPDQLLRLGEARVNSSVIGAVAHDATFETIDSAYLSRFSIFVSSGSVSGPLM